MNRYISYIKYHYKIILLFSLFAIVIAFLYFYIEKQIRQSWQYSINNKTKEIHYYAQNIEKQIKQICPTDLKECLRNSKKAYEINHILEFFSNPFIKYIYILQYNNKSLYYLADGSYQKEERGYFLQKFNLESNLYKRVLQTGKPYFEFHEENKDHNDLWMTYYYPLNDKQSFLVFDLSMQNIQEINSFFTPLHTLLRYLLGVILLLLLLSGLWAYLYIQQQRKNSIDPLTKLYNRNILPTLRENSNLKKDAVVMIDIDHFKKINDTYGHDVGDKAIQALADILTRSTDPKDTVVRMGGEEFLIILKDLSQEMVDVIVQRLRKKVEEFKLLFSDHSLSFTISLGVVPPGYIDDFDKAIKLADQMLYISKINGRNRVTTYGEKSDTKRSLIIEEIQDAIKNNQLLFYFQPIYSIKEQRIVKYEVLVRLKVDEFIYTPFEFLPLIKNSNTYRVLSKKLLQTSIEKIKKHHIHLSLNFDAHDFLDDTIFEMLIETFKKDRKISNYLTLELLEDLPIKDMKKVKQRVLELKKLGVSIAIDDFGDGYSSIKYILCFAPDIVKIDRSVLLILLQKKSQHRIFLESFSKMLQELHIKIVMEGVETQEDLEYLQTFDIEMIQGYYIAKPSPKIITDQELLLQSS